MSYENQDNQDYDNQQYSSGNSEGPRRKVSQVLGRIPRSLKIFAALVILVILFVVISVIGLVILLLVKVIGGGTLPGVLQGLLDFFQQNVQPLLDIVKQFQNVTGG